MGELEGLIETLKQLEYFIKNQGDIIERQGFCFYKTAILKRYFGGAIMILDSNNIITTTYIPLSELLQESEEIKRQIKTLKELKCN